MCEAVSIHVPEEGLLPYISFVVSEAKKGMSFGGFGVNGKKNLPFWFKTL